ncbi:cytochrome-c oxidase, cbb3-type subunit III [Pseudidiomarina terrestris]|uniref:cytochrome-c oxidase, cbb3-type subunit III n=1 Tax=Pseudidiomarina terrestris TaxID=2820060 RepID=UPI00264F99B9|nr:MULTISPECIES: cytochrome-c oxidase, cbb3-type subunit III [unclassified Pseudidiomarina]MDN7126532.1 cytochrome-c oxidase, cbb3-type subunit III [Pseudidiomarina sp. 1APR75-33.1]MDN7135143.1 cytochrome-c oxidase, cbb3-type subunit III [Pseudidiomarina sp. 1ASP75-5]MDN7137814.1 cytochrome-c oxidase, cbb3-type subunit III [Pseudidiomarina sp. 1ASP75-14]
MSSFWSAWIIVLTLGFLVGIIWLLRWTMTNFTGIKEGELMDHEFDGIVEINNPLPRWWMILFWVTIVWGLIYLALYPGLGNFQGLLGWKSSNQNVQSLEESREATEAHREAGLIVQYDREMQAAEERFGPIFEAYAQQPIKELAKDPEATEIGQRLFLQNCAQCHGSNAMGGKGFPNLTDDAWLYGGSPEDIKTSLLQGRVGQMPAFSSQFNEQQITELATYVLSLSGRKVDPELAAAGKQNFAVCSACHGQDGKGNQQLGAPNLTDNIWLYGGSQQAIEETLMNGRNGVMPAWKDILGEDKIHVISAYVYGLSND